MDWKISNLMCLIWYYSPLETREEDRLPEFIISQEVERRRGNIWGQIPSPFIETWSHSPFSVLVSSKQGLSSPPLQLAISGKRAPLAQVFLTKIQNLVSLVWLISSIQSPFQSVFMPISKSITVAKDSWAGHDHLNCHRTRRVVLVPQKHIVWSRGEWLPKGKSRCSLQKKGQYIEAGQAKTTVVTLPSPW